MKNLQTSHFKRSSWKERHPQKFPLPKLNLSIYLGNFFPYSCIHFCAKATGIEALFFNQELPFLWFVHMRIFSLLFSR